MAKRTGGFIGQDGINAPDPATGVTGTAGDGQVTVSWTAPGDVGGAAITGYNVQSNNSDGTFESSYNLNGASYDSVDFSVETQDTTPQGVEFKTDGTIMYIVGLSNNTVYQYTLSTAWDLSTASYAKYFSVNAQATDPYEVRFKSDGTKMFVVDDTANKVFQYSLSTAWDVSTASYDSVEFAVGSQSTAPVGIVFNSSGTSMYITDYNGPVYQYTLSTAWNLSTASYASKSLDTSGAVGGTYGIAFNSDGTKLFAVGISTDIVGPYSLTTAYDISTASFDNITFSVAAQENTPRSLFFKPDGTKMYVLGTQYDKVYQYTTGLLGYPTSSPVTINGLTNGTSYTFNVWAINPFGWSSPSDASGGVTPLPAAWAFWAGGRMSGDFVTTTIQRVSINTLGNTSDFGDLTSARKESSGCASSTRGIFMGGQGDGSWPTDINYITMATEGNAVNFGNLSGTFDYAAGLSNSTRGIIGGGEAGSPQNLIEYITIASTGNTTDFGDLTNNLAQFSAAASPTRGMWFGGFTGGTGLDVIQYVTIASTGNATDFGDLLTVVYYGGSCSNSTRALTAGGQTNSAALNTIQYNTIASTGNATDFGDLSRTATAKLGNASSTRALFGGSGNGIEYVEIATLGNSADFGDLLASSDGTQPPGPCSSAHGGLQ